jgi:hypothetical protein
MQPQTPPNAVAVEIVATRPSGADAAAIEHLSSTAGRDLAPVAYVVKVRLDPKPPPTSMGWALYVGDFRIPKYWEYPDGIYFKVFDPAFFQDHRGQTIRFTPNRTEFVDTGLVLAESDADIAVPARDTADLPSQEDVLR